MKKITLALLAAIASAGVASANTSPAVTGTSSTGFYAGLNLGFANTNVKYSYLTSGGTATGVNLNNFTSDTGKLSYLFGAFGGYGLQLNQGAYVGFELYGGFDSTKFNPNNDSASGASQGTWKVTVKRTNYYGIKPRVGYFLTPNTLAYLGFGVESGKWQAVVDPNLNATGTGSVGTVSNYPASAKQFKGSKSGVSFAPAIGLETYVTKNLFVRAEYSYLFGPKITVNQDITGYNLAGNSVAHTFRISQQAFKIGFGYKF
jgi:opacity protein-like surface antigen